jgi:UDP-N-acetylmuramyl pentapeptide phosphotransferase/UDP-N-acetylglucosamine-1-phosphate transferase
LLIAATILSPSKVRAVDIFGTQAFAKYPYLIVSLISFIPYFRFEFHGMPDLTASLIFFGLLTIVFTIWTVVLMYNAYSVSANLTGVKAIVSFIVALMIAEVLFKILMVKSYPFLI